jgi:uncharacterized RDD family membrane protein YckC
MTPHFENDLRLATPEGVVFSLRLAGPGIRLLALCLDLLVISAIGRALYLTSDLFPSRVRPFGAAVLSVAYFAVSIGYGIVFEWLMRGQTVGKRLLRLRVMDGRALPLTFPQVVVRNLMRVIDALPLFYLVGGAAATLSRHYRRLGDMLAGTVVVRETPVGAAAFDRLACAQHNSLLARPALAARLRALAVPAEAELVLSAVLRRESLEPTERARLYRALVEHLQSLVSFPEELVEPLSDEQYLRDVIGILFPSRLIAG